MELTDSERAEFIALTQDSYDPDLWDESDLPFLRAARAECEREQERQRTDVLPPATESDSPDREDNDPDPRQTRDDD
jgi:hypothetical protein